MSRMDSQFSNTRQDILYRFAFRLLGNREDALDVLQDVLEKLWKKRQSVEGYKSIEALSIKMTRDLCLDRLRQKSMKVEKLKIIKNSDSLLEPYAAPGEGWFYSNTNYVILGEIINKATSTTVSHQLKSRFFEPLGLHNSYFAMEELLPSQLAHGWFDITRDGSFEDISLLPETGIYSVLGAAAAIFSTAEEIAIWCSALFRGNVISSQGLQRMLDPISIYPGSTDIRCGMGVFLISSNNSTGVELIGYTGRTFGYLASMFYIPETDASVVVLINSDDSELLDSVTSDIMVAINED
ncbi:MAG: serine hydrolase [Bacteroidota bacterium]